MVESQIPKKIGDGIFKRKTKTAQWNPSSEPRKRSEMKPPYYIVVGSKKDTLYPFDQNVETVHSARRCKHLETAIRFRSKVLKKKLLKHSRVEKLENLACTFIAKAKNFCILFFPTLRVIIYVQGKKRRQV